MTNVRKGNSPAAQPSGRSYFPTDRYVAPAGTDVVTVVTTLVIGSVYAKIFPKDIVAGKLIASSPPEIITNDKSIPKFNSYRSYQIYDICVGYHNFTHTGVLGEDRRKKQIQIHKYLPFHSKAPKAVEETQ